MMTDSSMPSKFKFLNNENNEHICLEYVLLMGVNEKHLLNLTSFHVSASLHFYRNFNIPMSSNI